jgi:hypothetical protein
MILQARVSDHKTLRRLLHSPKSSINEEELNIDMPLAVGV